MEQKIGENPLIKKWLRLKRSPATKRGYLIRIRMFLNHFKMTPEELLEMSPKEARELCLIYQNEAVSNDGKKLSNNAILARQTAVASFLDHYDKTIKWKRNTKVRPRPDVTSHVFSNGDLSRMFQVGDTRDKAMLALASSLGWEISSFVDFEKETLSELLERHEEEKKEAKKTGENIPDFVYFRTIRNKTGQPRLAILNPLAIEWSRKWLKEEPSVHKWNRQTARTLEAKLADKFSDIFDLTDKGINYRMKILAKRAGLKTTGAIKFHNIRKWVMSGLSRSGFNEFQIKYVLGKSIPMSDGTYLQTLEQEVKDRYPSAYENYLNLDQSVSPKAMTTLTKEIDQMKQENVDLKQRLNSFTLNNEQVQELLRRIEKLEQKAKQ